MPTPSSDEFVDARSLHSTCPPEDERPSGWRTSEVDGIRDEDAVAGLGVTQQPTPPSSESQRSPGPSDTYLNDQHTMQTAMVEDMQTSSSEILSPVSMEDTQEESEQSEHRGSSGGYSGGSSSMSNDFSNIRLTPSSPSSFLRAGSKFKGTQQSERQVYEVQVEIKHVDMRESFLCGYLRIQGLTEDHPTLTTYFEGEIIGSKYSFLTQHEDWGSTDKVDLQHWAKFNAFRPFQKQARKGNLYIQGLAQRDNIFMRWKEHFLVPDHRVRTISGASFEGFYYICFNQRQGTVSGIYFHAKSEKFQQLELKHVEDRGCFPAMEFR